jgi:hypothetical protein
MIGDLSQWGNLEKSYLETNAIMLITSVIYSKLIPILKTILEITWRKLLERE